MHSFDWGQFIASTATVLLMLGGVWWWVRRNRGLSMSGTARRIEVLEALPLSLKHKMVLIQIDDQMVLATVSPGEVKTLHAWTQGASDAA